MSWTLYVFTFVGCFVCYWIGFLFGRRYEARKERYAGMPEYDVLNPINTGSRETVEICGATWYKMNGRNNCYEG